MHYKNLLSHFIFENICLMEKKYVKVKIQWYMHVNILYNSLKFSSLSMKYAFINYASTSTNKFFFKIHTKHINVSYFMFTRE